MIRFFQSAAKLTPSEPLHLYCIDMTPEEIQALPPGPELDRLVAKTIRAKLGQERSSLSNECVVTSTWRFKDRDQFAPDIIESDVPFRPSVNWNDAMFAAEKAGLWHPTETPPGPRAGEECRRFSRCYLFPDARNVLIVQHWTKGIGTPSPIGSKDSCGASSCGASSLDWEHTHAFHAQTTPHSICLAILTLKSSPSNPPLTKFPNPKT